MTVFEPRYSCVRNDHSTNWVTTTAHIKWFPASSILLGKCDLTRKWNRKELLTINETFLLKDHIRPFFNKKAALVWWGERLLQKIKRENEREKGRKCVWRSLSQEKSERVVGSNPTLINKRKKLRMKDWRSYE